MVYRTHLLTEAIASVEEFLATLNTSRETCTCCGVNRYVELTEARAAEQLQGVINTLRRHEGSFRVQSGD